MSSSFLPQFFFRRDDDLEEEDANNEEIDVERSSSADYSFDLRRDSNNNEEEDTEENPLQLSQLLEYSDSDDDLPKHHRRSHSSRRRPQRSLRSALSDDETMSSHKRDESPQNSNNSSNNSWIQQLVCVFRTGDQETMRQPHHPHHNHHHHHHRRVSSLSNPAAINTTAAAAAAEKGALNTEQTPLLSSQSNNNNSTSIPPSPYSKPNNNLHFHVAVAASFLKDYEVNRPPSLSRNLQEINLYQLHLHQIKFSGWFFPMNLCLAVCALFLSSALEGSNLSLTRRLTMVGLNLYAACVLAVDLWMRRELRETSAVRSQSRKQKQQQQQQQQQQQHKKWDPRQRDSRSQHLTKPMIVFLVVLMLETMTRLLVSYIAPNDHDEQQHRPMILFSSIFKPMVLYYVSKRARDALAALRRILRTVMRVLLMELLIILMFAAIACRLFANFERFRDLSTAWLSLFELATTVVNPSIWLPMYNASKYSAIFFVFYIVTTVFYLHSLVLSVVFQTYLLAASEIHERGVTDREDAVHLSYLALRQHQPQRGVIATESVRQLLAYLRPHYNSYKINALVEIVAPNHEQSVDYPTYRTKIRQALNASIRTARTASTVAMSVELLALVVAIVNFVYVMLVSSSFNYEWFTDIQGVLGCIITVVATLELVVRFNPLRISDFTPLTRLNTTFDGLALLGASISAIGIALFAAGTPNALEFILMGRSVDIFRVMRFFPMFRDIVYRSADVLPVLAGPIVLVLTTLHIFNYVGMLLWGGAIDVGQHSHQIERLYDLNNFNSYQEGIVTMFQLLVVNDWHAIAEVFFYANRCSSPYIVVPFFVSGNIIGVSIMLNVMTAFFVQAFVAKVDDEHSTASTTGTTTGTSHPQKVPSDSKLSDFSIKTSENSTVRRICSTTSMHDQTVDNGADADSEGSSASDMLEFDVYEREGFDKIMQTVAGGYDQSHLARDVCDYLETYEKLASDREPVGFMICDQLTMERFGNIRFQTRAEGFLDVNQLHVIVSDMHSELLALSSRLDHDRSLIRTYPHHQNPKHSLEITAALLRRHPAMSLFVSRRRKRDS